MLLRSFLIAADESLSDYLFQLTTVIFQPVYKCGQLKTAMNSHFGIYLFGMVFHRMFGNEQHILSRHHNDAGLIHNVTIYALTFNLLHWGATR